MGDLSSTTLGLMERYLDLAARRQAIISQNLAHVDTPGYRAQDIPFEEYMHRLVSDAERQGPERIGSGIRSSLPDPEDIPGLRERSDRNNVDVDREITAMGSNTSRFSVVTQLLTLKLRLLRSAMSEGGR